MEGSSGSAGGSSSSAGKSLDDDNGNDNDDGDKESNKAVDTSIVDESASEDEDEVEEGEAQAESEAEEVTLRKAIAMSLAPITSIVETKRKEEEEEEEEEGLPARMTISTTSTISTSASVSVSVSPPAGSAGASGTRPRSARSAAAVGRLISYADDHVNRHASEEDFDFGGFSSTSTSTSATASRGAAKRAASPSPTSATEPSSKSKNKKTKTKTKTKRKKASHEDSDFESEDEDDKDDEEEDGEEEEGGGRVVASKSKSSNITSTSTSTSVNTSSSTIASDTTKDAAKKAKDRLGSTHVVQEWYDSDVEEDIRRAQLKAGMAIMPKSPLHQISWFRIVLDEAHMIKDRSTQTAKAVFNLVSMYKWCLSGTPLQNRVGELYSLVRFLRFDPHAYYVCNKKGCHCKSLHYRFRETGKMGYCADCNHTAMQHNCVFNKHILNPIKRYGYVDLGKRAMLKLKGEVLDEILLRRTKETRAADVQLPPRIVTVRKECLDKNEEDFYTAIYSQSKAQFGTYVQAGTVLNNYANIFEVLMRLRQAIDHPYVNT